MNLYVRDALGLPEDDMIVARLRELVTIFRRGDRYARVLRDAQPETPKKTDFGCTYPLE
jgi:hypothetical protein